MKKQSTKHLRLSTETLRQLSDRQLAGVAGGTDLITVDDPITRPKQSTVIVNSQTSCLSCTRV